MNSVRKGNEAENRVAAYLIGKGWLVGKRRTLKGGGDILAIKPGYLPRLYECKATRDPWANFGPADRADLLATAEKFGAEAILALSPTAGIPQFLPSNDWPRG